MKVVNMLIRQKKKIYLSAVCLGFAVAGYSFVSYPYLGESEFDQNFECARFTISADVLSKYGTVPNPERAYRAKFPDSTPSLFSEPPSKPLNTIRTEESLVVDEAKNRIYLPIQSNPSPGNSQCGAPGGDHSIVTGFASASLAKSQIERLDPVGDASMGLKSLTQLPNGRFLGLVTVAAKPMQALIEFEPGENFWKTLRPLAPFAKRFPYEDKRVISLLGVRGDKQTFCTLNTRDKSWELIRFDQNIAPLRDLDQPPENPDPNEWDDVGAKNTVARFLEFHEVYPFHHFSSEAFESEFKRVAEEGISEYIGGKNPLDSVRRFSGLQFSKLAPAMDVKAVQTAWRQIQRGNSLMTASELWEKLTGTTRAQYIDGIKRYWYRNFLKGRGYLTYPVVAARTPVANFPIDEDRDLSLMKVATDGFERYLSALKVDGEMPADLTIPSYWKTIFETSVIDGRFYAEPKHESQAWLGRLMQMFTEDFLETNQADDLRLALREQYKKALDAAGADTNLSCAADGSGRVYVQSEINPVTDVITPNGLLARRIYDSTDQDLTCAMRGEGCDLKLASVHLKDRLASIVNRTEKEERRYTRLAVNHAGQVIRTWKSKDRTNVLEGYDSDGRMLFGNLQTDLVVMPNSGKSNDHFYFLRTQDAGTEILQCALRSSGGLARSGN